MKLIIRYQKKGLLRFISHLDVERFWRRVVRRALLPVTISAGFSPKEKIEMGYPLPVGCESEGEDLVLETLDPLPIPEVAERLAAALPEGITLVSVLPYQEKGSLFHRTSGLSYQIKGFKGSSQDKIDYLPEMILERDKERRSLSSHCTTQAMRDAVAAQKQPGPSGSPVFGSLRRCSSSLCRSGHTDFVAPCTDLKSGTSNSEFYSEMTPVDKTVTLAVENGRSPKLWEYLSREFNLSLKEVKLLKVTRTEIQYQNYG